MYIFHPTQLIRPNFHGLTVVILTVQAYGFECQLSRHIVGTRLPPHAASRSFSSRSLVPFVPFPQRLFPLALALI